MCACVLDGDQQEIHHYSGGIFMVAEPKSNLVDCFKWLLVLHAIQLHFPVDKTNEFSQSWALVSSEPIFGIKFKYMQ